MKSSAFGFKLQDQIAHQHEIEVLFGIAKRKQQTLNEGRERKLKLDFDNFSHFTSAACWLACCASSAFARETGTMMMMTLVVVCRRRRSLHPKFHVCVHQNFILFTS